MLPPFVLLAMSSSLSERWLDEGSVVYAAPKSSFSHPLVLHFDLNETILIGDEAGGDSRDESLHKIMAKSAFVKMPAKAWEETTQLTPTHWWNGLPIEDEYDGAVEVPKLYTGWEWPEGCCPYYRTAYKKRAKDFCDHHGSLYRPLYDQLDANLEHILPAFFETLVALIPRQPTIVLRTFGTDLPEVARVLSDFCQGQHPDFPDVCHPEWILRPEHLLQGKWTDDGVYELWRGAQRVASGDSEIVEYLHSCSVCGIQDDYCYWKKRSYEPWAGKPVWALPDVQHILLDDNIHNLEHDSIAGVRQQQSDGTFRRLQGKELLDQQGIHLIRVPTIAPLLRHSWFLEQIQAAQERFISSSTESSGDAVS